jgi:hypothetical protein
MTYFEVQSQHFAGETGIPRENLVDISVDIRTDHLLNTSQVCYRLS